VQNRDTNHFLNGVNGRMVVDYVEDVKNNGMDTLKKLNYINNLQPRHFLKAQSAIQNSKDKKLFGRFAKAWHSYHRFEYYPDSGETAIIPQYKTPIEDILEKTDAKTIIISMSEFQGWMLKDYLQSGGKGSSVDVPLHPNEQSQLVICDAATRPLMYYANQRRYDKYNKEIENIENIIRKFGSFIQLEHALLFAPNIKVRNNLRTKLDGVVRSIESFDDVRDGKESKEAFLDHARSATSGGIEIGKRFGFLINLPMTPQDAFKDRELVSGIQGNKMRDDEISYALKNCLGRLKAPDGKEPSIVFLYGARKEDVQKYYFEKKEITEIRQRKSGNTVKQILSEVVEYAFLWYRLFKIEPTKRMQYVDLFYDIDIPAVHRNIWHEMKKKKYANFRDFDYQIKDLKKWHNIENNKEALSILGIERDGKKFSLPENKELPMECNIKALEKLIDKYIYGTAPKGSQA